MDNPEEKKDQVTPVDTPAGIPKTESPKEPNAVKDQPKPAPEGKAAPEKKAPGKFTLFMRRLLRSMAVALILFGAGLITGYFLLQRPAVNSVTAQVDQLEGEKAELESQITDLESEINDLEGQVKALKPFEEENVALAAELANSELHVQVLSVLRDVQSAQFALADGEVDAAALSLTRTEEKLEDLRGMLPADNQGVVDGMLQRLELALNGLADEDFVAAASDLAVLANSLTEIENKLFTAP